MDEDVYSTFPLLLIDSLRKRGHNVNLIIPSIIKKSLVPLHEDTKHLTTIRSYGLSRLTFLFMSFFYLPRAIRKWRPDGIITNIYDWPGMGLALLFPKIKLLIDIRSEPSNSEGFLGKLHNLHYIMSIKFAKHFFDGITVTSRALKEEICRVYGLNPTKVAVITNGVSLDVFKIDVDSRQLMELKTKLHIVDKYIIFYHGSIGDKRGILETIEAMAKIKHLFPDIVFFILGSVEMGDIHTKFMSKVKSFINEKNLVECIYIHNRVPHEEVPKFISMCDVGIIPCSTDSFPKTSCPIKLLEYLAMGKPAISTNIPFSEELQEYGNCCILMSSNDPKVIASKIEHAYKNRSSLEQMGKVGRMIIEHYYTWDAKAKDLEIFISDML